MAYVSCKYAPPPPPDGPPPNQQMIVCVDEEGIEYWVPPDSTEGNYLRFIEAGGTIEPYEPPEEPA